MHDCGGAGDSGNMEPKAYIFGAPLKSNTRT